MNTKDQISKLTVKEAGARGGAATYAKYGAEHFREIGRKGQARLATRITSRERRAWGSKGGRPKKRSYFAAGESDDNSREGAGEPAR